MTRQAWTAQQVVHLRQLAGLHPLKEVARLMGRSHSSVKNATCKHGINCGRAWTAGQLNRLRADYGKLPARHLAQLLGRPLPAVYRMARKLGLSRTASRFREEDFARIRTLNAQGWSDTEIAHALGRDRHETTRHRKRLDLPSQQHGLIGDNYFSPPATIRIPHSKALRRQLDFPTGPAGPPRGGLAGTTPPVVVQPTPGRNSSRRVREPSVYQVGS